MKTSKCFIFGNGSGRINKPGRFELMA